MNKKQKDAVYRAYCTLLGVAEGPQMVIDRGLSDFRAGMELHQRWAQSMSRDLEILFPDLIKEQKEKYK